MTAGAETMLGVVKALTKLCLDDVFGALDMENAFGEVSRAEVLEEIIAELLEIAPFLVQLWGDKGTLISIASDCSSWAVIFLVDGLFQGHNLSSLLFCMALRRAMRRFMEACDLQVDLIGKVIHLEYIDDMFVKIKASVVHVVVPLLETALASVNLKLNRS